MALNSLSLAPSTSFTRRGLVLPCRPATPVLQPHPLGLQPHPLLRTSHSANSPCRQGGVKHPAPRAAAAAAAAAAEQQAHLTSRRDMVVTTACVAVAALALIVLVTLAVGGGQQVWSWLKALHAQGVEAATWAEVLGLLLTVGGALWVAVTLVWQFSQTTRSVEELRQEVKAQQQELQQEVKAQQQELRQEIKAQQQELRQEIKAQQQELRQEIMAKLDQVLANSYEKRLENVEAVVYRQATVQ